MSCIFPNCTSTKYLCKKTHIQFFKVPITPGIRKQWLKACQIYETELPKEPIVCTKHFLQKDISINSKRIRLHRDAIPMTQSQLNENCTNEEYIEEYLDEYVDEHETYLKECQVSQSHNISRKIVRKSYTTISTQTDISIEKYKMLVNNQLSTLNEKIASLELQLSLLQNRERNPLAKLNYKQTVSNLQKKSPRYKLEDISFAISLYSAGPRCYTFLRQNDYPLPSPTTLRRWASKLNTEPGLQNQLLSNLMTCDLSIEEKLCVLSFDEMKCREEWAYHRKNDIILEPKRMVQVAMVRGLRGKWKQPIFYDFDTKMCKNIVLNMISELYKIGFTVVAAVSDLGPENQNLWKSMDVSPQKPFFEHPSNGKKYIFVFADIPHLIKLIRNHFVDDGFFYNSTCLNKSIIEELIGLCNSDLNIIKNLSLEMLNVKGAARQKVKTATKLFTHTVAAALKRCVQLGLCSDAKKFLECSELFQTINDWFDVFNTRIFQKDSRPFQKAYGIALKKQNEILHTMSDIIRNLFSFRKSGYLLPFQKGILQNNNALPLLLDDLQKSYGMSFILTSKLNQDCLENFFSAIRAKGGLHDHPSQLEFKYRFRSYMLGRKENILCDNANVEKSEDNLVVLKSVEHNMTLSQEIFGPLNEIPIDNEEKIEIIEQQETQTLWHDVNNLKDIEFDGLENFAGYIISKMGLTQFGFRTSEQKDTNYSYVNILSEGGLYKPNPEFLKYIQYLNSVFFND